MAVPPADHDLGVVAVRPIPVVVPVPISLAYLHPIYPDMGVLRDNYRFVNNDGDRPMPAW
jgi:hypothetical protein